MKTSIFEPTLFKKNIRRFMPLWISYFFIWILILSAAILNVGVSESALEAQSSLENLDKLIRGLAQGAEGLLGFAFMIISAVLVFSFMQNENSTVFISSLPLRRGNIFFTSALSGIVPIIIANIVVFTLMLLLSLSMELKIASALVYWLWASSLISLGYYGIAVFCCNVTGNAAAAAIIYVILNFAATVVYIAFIFVANFFLFGFIGSELNEAAVISLSPPVKLAAMPLFGLISDFVSTDLYLIVFALTALALIIVSSVLFKRRRMETAGEFISQSCLRPIFKVCMGLGSALVLGVLFYSIFFGKLRGGMSFALFLLCALAAAAIGYCVGEALLEKKLGRFRSKKSNLLFAAVLIVVAISVVLLNADVTGFEKKLPEPGNVESVSVMAGGLSVNNSEDADVINEAVKLHKLITESEAESLDRNDESSFGIDIIYKLKNGSTLRRNYRFSYDSNGDYSDLPEVLKALERFMNLKPVILERLRLDFANAEEMNAYIDCDLRPVEEKQDGEEAGSLTKEFDRKLFRDFYENAVMKDAVSGNIGRCSILADKKAAENFYDCKIRMFYIVPKDDGGIQKKLYLSWSVRPEKDSEHTLAWLQEHGINTKPCTESEGWQEELPHCAFWFE